MSNTASTTVVTVTLNPTIDRIIEVPDLQVGGHLAGRTRSRLVAGKAINVTRALGALGVASVATGWVGRRELDRFDAAVRDAGGTPRFTPIRGESRENITLIDQRNRVETHLRDAGPRVDPREIAALADTLVSLATCEVIMVFTGSCAAGFALPQYADMLDACASKGARVVVDAEGERLRTAVRHHAWMIKPNEHELRDLVDVRSDSFEAMVEAGQTIAANVAIVLITLGARGAIACGRSKVWHGSCALPPERVVSTVGCGDAMLGGFLAGLIQSGGDPEEALRQGLAVSAASALHEQPATFEHEDYRRLLDQAALHAWNG